MIELVLPPDVRSKDRAGSRHTVHRRVPEPGDTK